MTDEEPRPKPKPEPNYYHLLFFLILAGVLAIFAAVLIDGGHRMEVQFHKMEKVFK